MTNFEILNGGGRRRGTRVHVFINYIIKVSKTNNEHVLSLGGGGLHIGKTELTMHIYVNENEAKS